MKKGDARSFRFNEERINFAKEKLKLNNKQEVLDYLIDEFWYMYHGKWAKLPEMPKIPENGKGFFQQQPVIHEKPFQQHMNEIGELEYEAEYKKKAMEIESATNLSAREKNLLLLNMKKPNL